MSSPPEKNDSYQSSEFQENLELLRQTYFFSGLPIESLKVFAYISDRETFRAGDYLFRQDEDDGQAFYIISGSAALSFKDDVGERDLGGFKEGDFIGGLTLMGARHRLFSLKASSDLVCMVIHRDKFDLTLQQFPEVMLKIVKVIVERINNWEKQALAARDPSCDGCCENIGVSLI